MLHESFAGSNFCDFSSDPQKYVPVKKNLLQTFFPQKFAPGEIFSNLNSLHNNTEVKNHVCPITTCLKTVYMNYWFYIEYTYCGTV